MNCLTNNLHQLFKLSSRLLQYDKYKICMLETSSVECNYYSLQAEVDVIKDMVMLREDKEQCIFTNDDIETVIKSVCTE